MINLPPLALSILENVALVALTVWTIFWKGFALWHAAKNNQRNWFVAILILSTVGILELVYLLKYAKNKYTVQTLRKTVVKNLQEIKSSGK